MTKLIPVRVPKGWIIYKQLLKVQEELNEALEAYNLDKTVELLEELVDVQVACETALAVMGADERYRNILRDRVNEKNRTRGYHDD